MHCRLSWQRQIVASLEQLVAMARAKVGDVRVALAVVHTDAEQEVRQVLEQVRRHFKCAEAQVTDASTALASHARPVRSASSPFRRTK